MRRRPPQTHTHVDPSFHAKNRPCHCNAAPPLRIPCTCTDTETGLPSPQVGSRAPSRKRAGFGPLSMPLEDPVLLGSDPNPLFLHAKLELQPLLPTGQWGADENDLGTATGHRFPLEGVSTGLTVDSRQPTVLSTGTVLVWGNKAHKPLAPPCFWTSYIPHCGQPCQQEIHLLLGGVQRLTPG